MNEAELEEWSKKWLYDVVTFKDGDRKFPFVKTLDIDQLAQLHDLLKSHAKDIAEHAEKLRKEALGNPYL